MPDPIPTPTPPLATTPLSPTVPGGTSGGADPSTTPKAEPFRFPDDPSVPAWARGKTAQEVLNTGDTAYRTLQSLTAQPAAAAAAPTEYNAARDAIGADEYVTGKDLAAARQSALNAMTPTIQQALEISASNALSSVRERNKKYFERYGPEITSLLATIPKPQWTIDNLEKAVKFVLADHVDELARERSVQLASEMVPTMRPSGAGSAPSPASQEPSLDSDKLPEVWRTQAKQVGIGERELWEFCRANDITPEEFFQQFGTTFVTDAVRDVKFR